MLRSLKLMCGAPLLIACAMTAAAQTADRTTVRTSVNPLVYSNLPVFLASDKGYFAGEKLNMVINRYSGSSTTQMPLVARGDLDIVPTVGGPALFNARNQGFDIKLLGVQDAAKEGWNDAVWVIVRKDLWDSGSVRSVADLKGRSVDGSSEGSPANVVMRTALSKAGLSMSDVKFSARLGTPPDWLAALRNNAVDALTAVEPIASQLVKQGLGVKLISTQQVLDWYPSAYYTTSSEYLSKNRPAAVAFMRAILRAQREVVDGGPRWNPDTLKTLAAWSKMSEDDIKAIPSPPYYGRYGEIPLDRMTAEQNFWMSLGLVKQRVDPESLIDTSVLAEARTSLGIK